MRNIIVGIGGTGAKCVEATIHLAAAGLLRDETKIYLADQDTANALCIRARELADLYGRVNSIMADAGNQPFASSAISMHKDILQPIAGADSSLGAAFGLSKTIRPGIDSFDDAILAQALFTQGELNQDMKKGFVAKPSIGSAAFTKAAVDNNDLWRTLTEATADRRTGDLGIVLMGSIFGGTGAAGVPTLAQHLKRRLIEKGSSKDRLAAVLMLPYFFVQSDPGGKPSGYGPVDTGQVPRALRYYSDVYENWNKKKALLFDGLYLVGLHPMIGVADDNVGGGAGQTNPPLAPEVVAGLGACHFLRAVHSGAEDDMGKAWYCARRAESQMVLDDLPGITADEGSGKATRAAIASLVLLRHI